MTTDIQPIEKKAFGISNLLLIIGLSLLIAAEAYCGYHVTVLSRQREQLKEDYSTIHNVTFGIFSVDQWRDKILEAVSGRVQDFKMTPQQKKALQAQVEQQLHGLVRQTAAEFNKPQKTLLGKFKKLAFNTVVDIKEVQAQVPSFARTIVTKINSPASTKRLKNIATSKLGQLKQQTYDSTAQASTALTAKMYSKYHVPSTDAFNQKMERQIRYTRGVTNNYAYIMFGCVVLAIGLWLLLRKQVYLHSTLFILSLLMAFVLLGVGVTASIIEVDARIATLNFMMLGEKISFENQVLFFQSKSILQIIQILVHQPKFDAVMVGVLLFIFVIVLPLVILTASGLHVLGNQKLAENRVISYLAFESGKWNMADVMVVGILMTYIGLNGILKSQLSSLNIHNSFLTTVTTNNSSLQPGFLIFTAYVLYELVLSRMLARITRKQA